MRVPFTDREMELSDNLDDAMRDAAIRLGAMRDSLPLLSTAQDAIRGGSMDVAYEMVDRVIVKLQKAGA